MGKLKPIGSEKLTGQDKVARIMEIARYGEVTKNKDYHVASQSFTKSAADGNVYSIVQEKDGYYLKSGIWELGDQSPDEVLIMLLKDHIESFILALKKEQGYKVVWLRLIHGHELRSVEKVIMAFFQSIQRKKKFQKIINYYLI